MRIIITGGTGLIGKPLAHALEHIGHEVIVLTRSPERVTGISKNVNLVRWDGKTAAGWGELVDGSGAIINLAGESVAGDSLLSIRWTEERKRSIRESRINAGRAVVDAVQAARQRPPLVVQASAVGFYGSRSDGTFDESAPAGSDFLANICLDWEAVTRPVENMGVRRAVVRIGVVLAAQGGALPRQLLPFKLFVGGPIGSGKQGYPWTHLDDVVRAITFLVENPQSQGAYNLTAPHPVTNAAFGKALGRIMHRPAFIPAPAFVFKLAFGEASAILLDGQMPLPARLLQAGYSFKYPQVDAALASILGK
jgi:hypothetical protein